MSIKKRKFSEGIRLKGTDNAAAIDGEIRNDKTNKRTKVYHDTDGIDAAGEREIVTEDQTQTLTNKIIDATTATGTGSIKTDAIDATYDDALVSGPDNPTLGATTVQGAIDKVKLRLDGQNEASEITYVQGANTNVTGANVQAALDSADTSISTTASDATTALNAHKIANGDHTASNITNVPAGTIVSTDTQSAITELDANQTAHAALTAAHSVGEVVGTTEAQTLSNKSIQTPSRSDVKQDNEAALIIYAGTASDGQIVFATDTQKMYQVIGNALEAIGGGGSTSFEISQAAHAFVVGNGIYHDGTTFVLGKADADTTLSYYTVIEVIDVNTFVAADFGRITATAHGYTVGQFYFQSEVTAGLATITEPSTGFSNPLFYVEDANTLQIKCLRPNAIDGGIIMDQINDVSAPTPTDGQALVYVGANSRYEAQDISTQAELDAHAALTATHGVGEIVGTTETQVLSGKDIDGTTASNTSRITIPQDTKANLLLLTRKKGTILYASDEDKVYKDDGTDLIEIGSGAGLALVTNQTEATAFAPSKGGILVIDSLSALTFTQNMTNVQIFSNADNGSFQHIFSGVLDSCDIVMDSADMRNILGCSVNVASTLNLVLVDTSTIKCHNLNYPISGADNANSTIKCRVLTPTNQVAGFRFLDCEIDALTLAFDDTNASTIDFSRTNVNASFLTHTGLASAGADITLGGNINIGSMSGAGDAGLTFNFGSIRIGDYDLSSAPVTLVASADVRINSTTSAISGLNVAAGTEDILMSNGVVSTLSKRESQVNYLKGDDSDFEFGIGNWTGDTNIPIGRIASNQMRGNGFLNFINLGVATGEKVSVPFTIDSADLAKKMIISFDYLFEDVDYNDGDMRVQITQDPLGTPKVIRVNGEDIQAGTGTHYAQFQTDATITSYSLDIYRVSASATGASGNIDNVKVGPQIISHGTIVTDWSDPELITISASTTAPTKGTTTYDEIKWKREGQDAIITARYSQSTAGTAGSGFYRIAMPTGLKVDTSVHVANTHGVQGLAFSSGILKSGGNEYDVKVNIDNQDFFNIETIDNTDNGLFIGSTNRGLDNATTVFTVSFKVPIQGWSSNAKMSEDFSGRDVSLKATDSSTTITGTPTNITWTNTNIDTTGSFDGTTYTIPETGRYNIQGSLWINLVSSGENNTTNIQIAKGGFQIKETFVRLATTVGSPISVSHEDYFIKGDLITIQASSSGTTPTINSSTQRNTFTVNKLASPQTILENETVAARYTSSNGQVAGSDIIYEIKDKDTHNAYDSSGDYNIPISGFYNVSAAYSTNSVTWSAGDLIRVIIKKNGASITEDFVRMQVSVTVSVSVAMSETIYFDKGDKVRVSTQTSKASTLNTTARYNRFSIAKIK